MTKVQLELISDADLCLLLEKSMKFSYISNRESKANNKYIKPYGPKQESKHIQLDAIN